MIIKKLVIKTGSKCTLRCEKCGEFNPYLGAAGKYYSIDAETLSRDLQKISTACDEIGSLQIAGGEALLHSDLFLFITFAAELPNLKRIEIASNGTVIPDAITMNVLKKYSSKVMVLISDYSASGVDQTAVISALEANGINYKVLKDMVWLDKTDVSRRELTDKELLYVAQNCATYKKDPFFVLCNGILNAHCCTAASLLYYLDLHNECSGYYVDLRSTNASDVHTALDELNKKVELPMCRYCVPSYEAANCPAGQQIKS